MSSKHNFTVNPESGCVAEVERFIREKGFLKVTDDKKVNTHNKRNLVYSFILPGSDREVIMKITRCNPEYPFLRRLNVLLSNLLKNSAKRTYDGAMALRSAGISTFIPLAHWTRGISLFSVERYVLYEKIPADFSAADCKGEAEIRADDESTQKWNDVLSRVAQAIAKLHDHYLQHWDLAPGNLLVRVKNDNAEKEYCEIIMIDTEHVFWNRIPFRFFKRVRDLRSLRRLARHLTAADRRKFLERYLGADYNRFWLWVFASRYERGILSSTNKAGE